MAEWFKAHAWKACVGNTTVSSNLTLSASFIFETDGANGWRTMISVNFSNGFTSLMAFKPRSDGDTVTQRLKLRFDLAFQHSHARPFTFPSLLWKRVSSLPPAI